MQKSGKRQTKHKNSPIKDTSGKTEEWLRRMFEQSTLGMAISDKTFHFIAANPAFCTMLGYTEAELSKLTFKDITHPDNLAQDTESIQKLTRGEIQSYKSEKRYVTKSGAVVAGAVTVTALHDASGKHVHSLVVLEDITQRKLLEEAVSRSAHEWQKTFDANLDAIWLLDKDQQIIRCNKMSEQIFNRTYDEIIGKHCWEIVHGTGQPIPECPLLRVKRSLSRESMELQIGRRWFAVYVDPILDENGSISGYVHIVSDITERKQAEETLRESEERFSTAFKTSPYSYMIANMADGAIIEVNDAFTVISGYSREEAVGSSAVALNFWINEEDRMRMVASLRDGRPVVGLETRLRPKNGNTKTVLLSAQVIRLNNRPCILSIVDDITDRKRAEVVLRESEQRIRTFLDSTSDMAFLKDASFRHIIANGALCTFYGKTKSEIIGKTDFDLMAEKGAAKCRKTDEQTLLSNALLITEEDVGGRYYETIKFPVKLKEGENGVGAYIRDITDRKLAEEAVAAEKELLAVTLRSIGDAVIATDVQGNIVLMNKVAETLTGWPLDHAAGKPLSDVFNVINELTREHLENPVQNVLSTGNSIELANHTLLISRDGTERIIADSGAPIKDNRNKILGVVLVFRDITEKQKFMDTMHRTAKLDSLGILAGGIAHDFNNLLTGIFGYMDLARSVSKDSRISEYLEATLGSMNRAKALTQQLLTFAKGGSPIQKITPLIPFIQETAQFALSGSNISCRVSIAENVWPCNIDKNQIGQVIDNIVINAQQAMPDGGSIEISARNYSFGKREHPALSKGDFVKVSIKDSGIGIPKEIMPRIFDPFYTTKIKGHGLGLATCYSIVSRHGGCIDVESEPGKGSTFHVYLPASSEAVVAKAAAVISHKGSGTIIVMDDEEVVRDTFRQMLEMLGYTVVCKNDGKEAIDFFINKTRADCQFTALIFDLTVPGGMGGMEAVAKIRKFDAGTEIPIFVSSGYSDNSVMKNPVEYGFTASISKPFTLSELSEMLNKYLKEQE